MIQVNTSCSSSKKSGEAPLFLASKLDSVVVGEFVCLSRVPRWLICEFSCFLAVNTVSMLYLVTLYYARNERVCPFFHASFCLSHAYIYIKIG